MAVRAGISGGDVLCGLAYGAHPCIGGMAATTGFGGTFEYTAQMAAFAGHVLVRTGERKFRGIVVEVNARLGSRSA